MKFLSLLLATLLATASVYAADTCDSMTPLGKPEVSVTEKVTRLCRKMYVLEHSPSRHTAYWSAERLIGAQQGLGGTRKDAFKADPNLPKQEAAKPADYNEPIYDQGHMAPVGDMYADPAAMLESFYMSNMVPQIAGNNRGGWNNLEYYARGIAMKSGELYVITGPVYRCSPCKTIGRSKVAVPTHLYKILYNARTNSALSFLVPNVTFTGQELPLYISNIDTIQKYTRVTFFPLVTTPITESTVMWP